MIRRATAKVPGSCGELAQGVMGGSDFLITCPIDLYSTITVEVDDDIKGIVIADEFCKTKQALKFLLNYYQLQPGIRVWRRSELEMGLGMASSTADIAAACAALMSALGREIDAGLIARVALDIEPTDGTFFAGINLFDHRQGTKQYFLGYPPPLDVIIFSERGKINTLEFNSRPDLEQKNRQKSKQVLKAVNWIKRGLKTGNADLIGRGATISSLAHQKILFRSYLQKLQQMITDYRGIYGINIAHSGTVLGLLVEPAGDYTIISRQIEDEIPALDYLGRAQMIAGGLKVADRTYTRGKC